MVGWLVYVVQNEKVEDFIIVWPSEARRPENTADQCQKRPTSFKYYRVLWLFLHALPMSASVYMPVSMSGKSGYASVNEWSYSGKSGLFSI